jgi:hypothetical protein
VAGSPGIAVEPTWRVSLLNTCPSRSWISPMKCSARLVRGLRVDEPDRFRWPSWASGGCAHLPPRQRPTSPLRGWKRTWGVLIGCGHRVRRSSTCPRLRCRGSPPGSDPADGFWPLLVTEPGPEPRTTGSEAPPPTGHGSLTPDSSSSKPRTSNQRAPADTPYSWSPPVDSPH